MEGGEREKERVRETAKVRERERLKGGERERLEGGERESFFVYINSEQLELFHIIELISLN